MLTGVKDLDFKILNELEDVDLINVCQTNKAADDICKDQAFWLNRIMTKFPEIFRRKDERTWSEYYIKDLIHITPTNAQSKLNLGSKSGKLDWVIIAVKNGANIRYMNDNAVKMASEYGHLDVVKYLVENGADIRGQNDHAVRAASAGGHLDVVKYLVENGADVRGWNDSAVKVANRSGFNNIVDYLVSQGSPDPRVN